LLNGNVFHLSQGRGARRLKRTFPISLFSAAAAAAAAEEKDKTINK
jgi:hypothetical protein